MNNQEEKPFVWTDELVADAVFAALCHQKDAAMQGSEKFVEDFKQNKIREEEKIIIAGREVEFNHNNTLVFIIEPGVSTTISKEDMQSLYDNLEALGATHLTISGEQVPVSTLEKILSKLK